MVAGTRRVPLMVYGTRRVPLMVYGTRRVPRMVYGTRRVPATLEMENRRLRGRLARNLNVLDRGFHPC